MSAKPARALGRELALRLAIAGAAAVLMLAVVVGVFHRIERQRADDRWLSDAQSHFDRQTRRLEEEWLRQAEQLRAQIEFTGVLDGEDRRVAAARFKALMASLGGLATFTHVMVLDAGGGVEASYSTRSGDVKLSGGHGDKSWLYSEVDGLVYRLIRTPVQQGSMGQGELALLVPLNNALLNAIAFPDTGLSLHWQQREDIARSEMDPVLQGGGSAERDGQIVFTWAGDPGGPSLHVYRRGTNAPDLAELLSLVAAGALGTAALGWLSIGRWSRRHVRHIDAIASATDRFADRSARAGELRQQLGEATRDADLETRRLGDGLAAMMQATELAQAESQSANRSLAELNATLERRVATRTQELEVARDEALAAARAKERILAGVSHELRTPLVGLLGSLELVESQRLPDEASRLIEVSRRSGQALRNVIDDVLDYSRLEAVGPELRQLPFHVGDLASEAIGLHAAVALNKGLHLQCDCDPAAARVVRGDPVRLRQVLLNLIGNAVKFTDRGQVRLSVRAAPVAGVERSVSLTFEVSDTGLGISQADRERLFNPFVQAASGAQQGRGGTGLGLAIAQRLVAAMGGTIELTSQPGVGSSFVFTIPLALADEAPATPVQAGEPRSLSGRVLLVEDNQVNRTIATAMLRRLGLEVSEAENGMLAIEALRRQAVDVVLMDQMMPVLDGAATTERIRAGAAGAQAVRVPIIAVTAHAQAGDAAQCIAAGMNDYLAKPFTQRELELKLARWLRPQREPTASA